MYNLHLKAGIRQIGLSNINRMNEKIVESLKTRLPELTEAEIEGLLSLLSSDSTLTNEKLTQITGIPLETLKSFKKTLGNTNVSNLSFKPYEWKLLAFSNPSVEQKLTEIRSKFNLMPKREFDQFFATPASSVSKAQLLISRGFGAKGKNVLLLGDDDLVSVTLRLLGAQSNIYVADIDLGILSTIDSIVSDNKLDSIKSFTYDARKTPTLNTNFFDVVAIDPPYTTPGVDLFLARALAFLKNPSQAPYGTIHLFYGNSFKSPEKTFKIQQLFNKYNLVLEDKVNKFVSYSNADSIGNASSVYVLKTTPATKPLNAVSQSQIYTIEATKEEKFPFVDHVVFRVNKVPAQLFSSKQKLLSALGKFCNEHKLKVVDTKITNFAKQGMTITYVLSNSNLVVHTWPEYLALHIDLITCSPIYKKEQLPDSLAKLLGTPYISYSIVE